MEHDAFTQKHHDLLLSIWREGCRKIEVDQSLERILELFRPYFPLQGLVLYSVLHQNLQTERIAGAGKTPPSYHYGVLVVEESVLIKTMHWCRTGQVVRFDPVSPPEWIPPDFCAEFTDHLMAMPLHTEHGTLGVLMLNAKPASKFRSHHQRLGELLREPIAVTLENDRRLRELVMLREAAEADKQKLLTRLGRETISSDIVGATGGLKTVLDRVRLVAQREIPAIILGETGSGKEIIARAIHEASPRSEGPFIRVNCGAISPELIDSELFGHERGSFTGATATRRGWFERADGGTLFLDEIGELSPAAQVRLLRVVQEGSFERVGGEHSLHVNVRIVTATHRDLADMVQTRQFREDLWYRLAVFPIVLPPLRERREDIPALTEHFIRRAVRRFGLRYQSPTAADLELLVHYDWPGNIREFASVVDRAVILGDGIRLEFGKALGLSSAVGAASAKHPTTRSSPAPAAVMTGTLNEVIRTHIEKTLVAAHGKIDGPGGAAQRLDINPHTLRARMRKLGIDWSRYRFSLQS